MCATEKETTTEAAFNMLLLIVALVSTSETRRGKHKQSKLTQHNSCPSISIFDQVCVSYTGRCCKMQCNPLKALSADILKMLCGLG